MTLQRAVVTPKVLKEIVEDLRQRLNDRLMLEPLSEKPLFPTSIRYADKKPDSAALLEVLMIVLEYQERRLCGFGDVPEMWNEWIALVLADWEILKNGTPAKARFDGQKHRRK